jgi:light-harvesting complex II chlorophyll a/b binding protein 2
VVTGRTHRTTMAASALHQTTSFLGQALVSRAAGVDAGGRITMRRTVKSVPQSIWYVPSALRMLPLCQSARSGSEN